MQKNKQGIIMATVNYNNWQLINLSALVNASDSPFAHYEQMNNSIDTDNIYVTSYNSNSINLNVDSYTGILGGAFNASFTAFTVNTFNLYNSNESSTYEGTLKVNLNSGALSGYYTSLSYQSNTYNESFEFTGKLTTNSYTGDPSGGTATYIHIVSGGYEITIRGSISLNSNLDFTGGTITDLAITDNSGHSINASGMSMNARSFDQIFNASTPDINTLTTLIGASLTNNSTIYGSNIDETISGGSKNDTLYGYGGNDILNGGAGIDTMIGGDGNDTYIVDNIADAITELEDEGTDLVKASVSYTLGANIENLELTGTAAINGTGNGLENLIKGNAGNNILDGGAGIDSMEGGKGNDTYIVDEEDDEVIEAESGGTDLVKASVDYELSDFVENLTLTGNNDLNGTGNALANTITGNAGDNILDGGAGVDKLIGGNGDDTYIVDLVRTGTAPANYKVALQDTITETAVAGSGNDTVILRGVYSELLNATTLTLGANLENLDASQTGTTKLNLTGNALNNTLTGNDANNILDGGKGDDILIGGLGNDTLKGGLGADVFKWGADDLGSAGNISNSTDTITDFSITQGDQLDLRDLLDGESSANILDYISIEASGTSTVLRISSTGQFDSGYDSGQEDARIILSNTNLLTVTVTGNYADAIQYMINNQSLLID
jgi:Ca2+-binding RTX toxin-like protein